MDVSFPEKAQVLFEPVRYVVLEGGRGSAKSHSVATYLLLEGMQQKHRILCCREFQGSISDSCHKLLSDKISALGLESFYEVQRNTVIGKNGTEIIYAGLRHNLSSIKSMENISRVWLEEAQTVSDESLDVLIPTIRAPGSKIIITFNPDAETDPVYERFILNPPPSCISAHMSWGDNPFFPEVLDQERRYMLETDPEKYEWIWNGKPRKISNAVIFKGRVSVKEFETPENARLYFGADHGFANDPATLIRMFVQGKDLYIDYEAYRTGVELDDLPAFYDAIPGSRRWIILADASRPETNSYLKRQGFRIEGAPKWQGSIDDGISFLKGFANIYVHPRCPKTLEEFRSYSWKVDRLTGEILPIPVDRYNHAIDAIRYGLSPVIKKSGTSPLVWELLAS